MLYKCRTKRQAFPLRTFIICPLGFCAATGFLFGACDTGELEEKKKKKKMEKYCYLLSNYGVVVVLHTCLAFACMKSPCM